MMLNDAWVATTLRMLVLAVAVGVGAILLARLAGAGLRELAVRVAPAPRRAAGGPPPALTIGLRFGTAGALMLLGGGVPFLAFALAIETGGDWSWLGAATASSLAVVLTYLEGRRCLVRTAPTGKS